MPPGILSCRLLGPLALVLLVACGSDEGEPTSPETPPPPERVGRTVEPPAPRVGLWVLCEGAVRVLDDPSRIPPLIEDARALGATDLFVQVYRGGRAWFDSSIADPTPHRLAVEASGVDPLARLLEAADSAGLRVHAWVNALSLSGRRDSPLLERLGPDAVQVDRRGRSVLEYPNLDLPQPDRRWYRMGTPQVWLDPAAPQVAETLVTILEELVRRYPSLDGIHLDYIRYPDVLPFVPGSRFGVGMDFGYGEASRARFQRETGLVAPFGDSLANANRWDDWRRERVTEVVERVATAVRDAQPGIEVSAAVWAYADRSYLALFQDWRGWLEEGSLDFAVPMAYSLDDRLFGYLAHGTTGGTGGERVWIGIGAWLFAKQPERALAQIEIARSVAPAGISLFSYDSIAEAPALHNALVEQAAAETRASARGQDQARDAP